MDWSVVVLILGILAIIAVFAAGGRTRISKGGIEYNSEGLLHWLMKAREQKNVGSPDRPEAVLDRLKPPAKIPKARALWVDDQPLNNLYERQALASIGVFVDSYTNNADAEAASRMVDYDLVISDIGRGGQAESGWDLLRTVRSRQPNLPFFFYTGSVDEALQQDAQERGATGVTAFPDGLVRSVIDAVP